jgi:hypothetical protein
LAQAGNPDEGCGNVGLILWDSQQSSALLKSMLPRRIVRCLLCLLISTVFGYRRHSEYTYREYELEEGVPLHGLRSHFFKKISLLL